MLSRRIMKMAQRVQRQTEGPFRPVPRDCLPASYYAHQEFEATKKKALERKAKEFANWKLDGAKRPAPYHPFRDAKIISRLTHYMIDRNYIIPPIGQTAKSFMTFDYSFTPEGKKWAQSK